MELSESLSVWAAMVHGFGDPLALRVEEIATAPPGPGEVAVAMRFAPVNPADLLELSGDYGGLRPPPFVAGAEGAGVVESVGSGVDGLLSGKPVVCLTRGNWVSRRVLLASEVLAVPEQLTAPSAAMLRVNPATAQLLLQIHAAGLSRGDAVALNAAHSSVGHLLIGLAAERGLKVFAVTRTPDAGNRLLDLGATAVLRDDDDLPAALRSLWPEGLCVAYDSVAGVHSARLAACLRPGGRLVVYGHASGLPCSIPSKLLTFAAVTVEGFNLSRALRPLERHGLETLYAALAARVIGGTLRLPVERVYPLHEVNRAIDHARTGSRTGKILLRLDGLT